jgi:hypothetical protein
MVTYLPRSAWNARTARSGPGALTVSRVEGVALHWPGSSGKPIVSQSAVAAALRGWQAYHMDRKGWSDIAYQVAVDQAGRAWTLRGLRTQSGANGDADVNERYGAILLVLVVGEQPSEAMKATVRDVVADFRAIYPHGTAIKPHSAVRPAGTDCPGDNARAAITRGDFTPHTATGDDMQLTDVIPGLKDSNGKPVTVAQALSRGAWAYDQIREGGSIDKRLDTEETER